MFRLALLFITVTSMELYILIQISTQFNLGVTIALILSTGFLGAALARRQGFAVLSSIQESLQRGEMPTRELLDGVCILLAGALLVTPGFLTDLFGFALLTPPIRSLMLRSIRKRMESWVQQEAVVFTKNASFVYMDGDVHTNDQRTYQQPLDSRGNPPFEA
ncbi:MAG: FxsA family protein [Myxococcales bacterium]|nr:FxsA family protein [Myxococcales bacterium]